MCRPQSAAPPPARPSHLRRPDLRCPPWPLLFHPGSIAAAPSQYELESPLHLAHSLNLSILCNKLVCACATVEEEGDADPRVLAPFVEAWEEEQDDGMDLRLCLRGEYGRCVAMVLDSAVLCESSAFSAVGGKEIEVYGVENMAALRDAVEFMFDADAPRWLARAGVSRAIAVLECCQEKLAGYISKDGSRLQLR